MRKYPGQVGDSKVTECLSSVCKTWFNLQYIRERRRKEEKKIKREVGEKRKSERVYKEIAALPTPPQHTHGHTGTLDHIYHFCTRPASPSPLPGATGLIFKSSKPKSDLKEKGASAAGGSFSPMVTISGPLVLASGSTSTC